MERNWLHKLTSLHAPIRITPTNAYYNSYFYQVDSLAAASNYSIKTIGEKSESAISDPYAEASDLEIPPYWAPPDRMPDGKLIDPVKIAYRELAALQGAISGLAFQDYEISGALLRVTLSNGSSLSQMTYLLSIAEKNPNLSSLILDSPHFDAHESSGLEHLIYLPKSYKDNGVSAADRGTLNFSTPTAASFQEQRIEVCVAGFYDPGILAIGNKCVLVPNGITRSISAAHQTISPDGTPTNGIFVWISDLKKARDTASMIAERFTQAGIGSYWNISTYENFEFSKDLLLQFQSDRTLLLLIASIILIVACSNIISLLVLLVNDKKKEIAILQSMGASFQSISSIFAVCGVAMGALGCLFGSLAAALTLHHLDALVSILSSLQGHAAFNPAFFGQSLPNQLSKEALVFVLIATPILSLAAGLIPAIKASRIHPSSTLRSE